MTEGLHALAAVVFSLGALALISARPLRRWLRIHRYKRGREIAGNRVRTKQQTGMLRFGPLNLPASSATEHFLVAGTTGSGKSLIQRLLMTSPLQQLATGNDQRAFIFDAKNDVAEFLHSIGVSVPVYSFNPFEARSEFPTAVCWDIAVDITSPARALNLAASLIPDEGGGSNRYFSDAARQVVAGLIRSFIKHSPATWRYSDLVAASLSQDATRAVLSRDEGGRRVLDNFFGDERTGYQVFTTVASRMARHEPVAALWQRAEAKLSIRKWLQGESILLLGANATAKAAVDAINEVVFKVLVEEIDEQPDSRSRRTWIWIDEARLSGPLLRGAMLPYLAVKGRSKGAAIVLAFQDMEGLREAAGPRIANELVAQCSNKALLRMESDTSASWASAQVGKYETIEYFRSEARFTGRGSDAEQRVTKDAILPSEFFRIPVTSAKDGLNGYFVSPRLGALKGRVKWAELQTVFVRGQAPEIRASRTRPETEQWLLDWTPSDRERLLLEYVQPSERSQMRRFTLEPVRLPRVVSMRERV